MFHYRSIETFMGTSILAATDDENFTFAVFRRVPPLTTIPSAIVIYAEWLYIHPFSYKTFESRWLRRREALLREMHTGDNLFRYFKERPFFDTKEWLSAYPTLK
jgi:hypothetical protein